MWPDLSPGFGAALGGATSAFGVISRHCGQQEACKALIAVGLQAGGQLGYTRKQLWELVQSVFEVEDEGVAEHLSIDGPSAANAAPHLRVVADTDGGPDKEGAEREAER